jgi:hypothetical protein
VCIAKRKGVGGEYNPEDDLNTMRKKGLFVNEFSVADAKRAGVWGGTGSTPEKKKYSVWYKHPKRMLKMRARAFTLRDGWSDILKGMHSAEEMIGETITLKQNDMGGYEATADDTETIDLSGERDTSLYTKSTPAPVDHEKVRAEKTETKPDEEKSEPEADPEPFGERMSEQQLWELIEKKVAEVGVKSAESLAMIRRYLYHCADVLIDKEGMENAEAVHRAMVHAVNETPAVFVTHATTWNNNTESGDPTGDERTGKGNPAHNGPPEGQNMAGKPQIDWDPTTEPLMQRYVGPKAEIVKSVAEKMGIPTENRMPKEVHADILAASVEPPEDTEPAEQPPEEKAEEKPANAPASKTKPEPSAIDKATQMKALNPARWDAIVRSHMKAGSLPGTFIATWSADQLASIVAEFEGVDAGKF